MLQCLYGCEILREVGDNRRTSLKCELHKFSGIPMWAIIGEYDKADSLKGVGGLPLPLPRDLGSGRPHPLVRDTTASDPASF